MSPRRPLCGVHIPPVILLLLLALLQTCTPLLPSPEIKSEIERAIKTFITDDLKNKQGLTNEKELRSLLYLTGEQLAFGGASKLASDKEKAYPTNKIQKGCGKLHPWMVLAGLSEGDFFRLQDWTPSEKVETFEKLDKHGAFANLGATLAPSRRLSSKVHQWYGGGTGAKMVASLGNDFGKRVIKLDISVGKNYKDNDKYSEEVYKGFYELTMAVLPTAVKMQEVFFGAQKLVQAQVKLSCDANSSIIFSNDHQYRFVQFLLDTIKYTGLKLNGKTTVLTNFMEDIMKFDNCKLPGDRFSHKFDAIFENDKKLISKDLLNAEVLRLLPKDGIYSQLSNDRMANILRWITLNDKPKFGKVFEMFCQWENNILNNDVDDEVAVFKHRIIFLGCILPTFERLVIDEKALPSGGSKLISSTNNQQLAKPNGPPPQKNPDLPPMRVNKPSALLPSQGNSGNRPFFQKPLPDAVVVDVIDSDNSKYLVPGKRENPKIKKNFGKPLSTENQGFKSKDHVFPKQIDSLQEFPKKTNSWPDAPKWALKKLVTFGLLAFGWFKGVPYITSLFTTEKSEEDFDGKTDRNGTKQRKLSPKRRQYGFWAVFFWYFSVATTVGGCCLCCVCCYVIRKGGKDKRKFKYCRRLLKSAFFRGFFKYCCCCFISSYKKFIRAGEYPAAGQNNSTWTPSTAQSSATDDEGMIFEPRKSKRKSKSYKPTSPNCSSSPRNSHLSRFQPIFNPTFG